MDNQVQEWIRWGIGFVLASYVRYVHNQLRQEHEERTESIKNLNDRVNAVEIQSATSARDSEMLEKVRDKLDKLATVVYMMAGQMGIKTTE